MCTTYIYWQEFLAFQFLRNYCHNYLPMTETGTNGLSQARHTVWFSRGPVPRHADEHCASTVPSDLDHGPVKQIRLHYKDRETETQPRQDARQRRRCWGAVLQFYGRWIQLWASALNHWTTLSLIRRLFLAPEMFSWRSHSCVGLPVLVTGREQGVFLAQEV